MLNPRAMTGVLTKYQYTTSVPSQGLKFRGRGLVVLGGDNVSPLVEIGLADLPNIGGLNPSPHLATALLMG